MTIAAGGGLRYFLDFTRTQTLGACAHPLDCAFDARLDRLEVGREDTLGVARDLPSDATLLLGKTASCETIAAVRPLAAYFTSSRHDETPCSCLRAKFESTIIPHRPQFSTSNALFFARTRTRVRFDLLTQALIKSWHRLLRPDGRASERMGWFPKSCSTLSRTSGA